MSELTGATIWRELLAGEWVIVERRDATLQRTLVLRRASDAEKPARAFTPLEREVVAMAMQALPLKIMAAELGLSTSRVAEVLGRVRSKLGARTQADLLRMIGSFGLPLSQSALRDDHAHRTPAGAAGREKFLPKRMVATSDSSF